MILSLAMVLTFSFPVLATAAPANWSSGDLGFNVIPSGGTYESFPDLVTPSNAFPASLEVKYGVWNVPDTTVDVYFNGTLVGNFIADQGYINPGPEYASFDITGLLMSGTNTVFFTGNGIGGDYVVGQVDIDYDSRPPCDPSNFTSIIHGTPGNDRLKGTPEADLIFGYAGDDRIEGFGGDDCLCLLYTSPSPRDPE